MDIFKCFDDLNEVIRFNSRIIVNSYIGLDEAAIIPSNHTLIGILSNRSNMPTDVGEELSAWM